MHSKFKKLAKLSPCIRMSLAAIFIVPVLGHIKEVSAATQEEILSEAAPRVVSNTPLYIRELDLLSIVVEDTEAVQLQKLETLIAEQGIINAKSIFEPNFEASYDKSYNLEQNDTEQAVQRSSQSEYEKEENVYSTAITGILPTGTEYRIFYDLYDPENSLQSDDEYGKEFRAKTGLELTQPLLKDFGVQANRANIAKAEKELLIAEGRYRRTQMTSAYLAAISYADLQLAQERVMSEGELLKFEQESADVIDKMISKGKASRGQLFEAESNLARREARVSYARKVLRRSSAVVRQLLIGTLSETFGRVEAVDQIGSTLPLATEEQESNVDPSELVSKRPEYLDAKLQCELSEIRVDYAKNQNRPDLDLRVSYGRSGLGEDWSGANDLLDEDYEFWSVGANLVIPLVGNKQGDSTLAAALFRQQKDKLALANVETLIQDEIITANAEKKEAVTEVVELTKVITKLQSILDQERKKQANGKLSRYVLISREIELGQARMALVEKKIDYRKSQLTQWLAEGRLLDVFDLVADASNEN